MGPSARSRRWWSPRWIAAALALAIAAIAGGPARAQAWKPRKRHTAPRKAAPPPSPKHHAPRHPPHHAKRSKPKKKAPRRAVIIEEDSAER